jgi:Na+/H+ antiporter NhaD/arsenite permease-like protein
MAVLAAPVAVFLVRSGGDYLHALKHVFLEYVSFILLLASLYTVSGGIVLRGDLQGQPTVNAAILGIGAVLANFIGTTGASMLLIRPYLRINLQRRHVRHLPVFFIFLVSNLGGLLTPLGDPPLFLGFLRGVEFFWTLERLWAPWLVANGVLLGIFLAWDTVAYLREEKQELVRDVTETEPLRLEGRHNFLFLAGILIVVLLHSPQVTGPVQAALGQLFACPALTLHRPWGELALVGLSALAFLTTPGRLRQANGFSWGPIVEVAILFAGIFVAMVPALELLRKHGSSFQITEPWQYFWLTGSLSSFLDNAPTYLTFATMAAGEHSIAWLMEHRNGILLAAISCGAVFMGANTYIGNGPNFMVKAIADEAGMPAPSFFGYMVYSGLILLPLFGVITFLFFPPG